MTIVFASDSLSKAVWYMVKVGCFSNWNRRVKVWPLQQKALLLDLPLEQQRL